MLIEAIFENGQVRLLHPVQFVHDYFAVKIDIPDSEVIPQAIAEGKPTEVLMTDDSTHAEGIYPAEYLDFKKVQAAAFGEQYIYVPEKTDQEIMQEHWMKKYG